MKNFKVEMREYQEEWKSKYLPHINLKGWQNGKEYNHILPKANEKENFFYPIQNELFDSTNGYLKRNKVKPHTGIHNLLSSWTLCANMYWPFNNSEGKIIFAEWIRKETSLDIAEITEFELEYEDPEIELKPGKLLGEDNKGMRGSGQTSPDLAVLFKTQKGSKGILLIECKFTEHSFYVCSGYHNKKESVFVPNPDRSKCRNTKALLSGDFKDCHLNVWGRKYWDLLNFHLNKDAFFSLVKCPMSTCCYQIFRQQALAKGFEKYYDVVSSCVITDNRNTTLIYSGKSIGMASFPEAWKNLFPDLPFYWLTHNSWYNFVKEHNNNGRWDDWISYIGNRYDL